MCNPSDAMESWFDVMDARLIDRLHGGLPLTERPYADVGVDLDLTEDEVIHRIQRLLDAGLLTRFGPLFQIERAGGQFLLAAMAVPEEDFERITEIVNALPTVAHNYRRTHRLNMWFVVAAETSEEVAQTCQLLEQQTGIRVFAFPKEKEFFVELRLSAQAALTRMQREAGATSSGGEHGPH